MRRTILSSDGRKGVAIVEFTLSSIVLIPLLLGVFVFGFRLIRAIEMQQITRDLGHMYLERIDFRNAGPQQNAQTLASGFNLTGTGTSLVVLEQVKIEQQTDCDAANVAPPGTPCPNLNQPVFVEQLTIGNTTVGRSAFGTPPLQGNLTVSVVDQAENAGAVAQGFSTYLSLKPGEIAYVSEMINQTPELNVPGFSGEPQVYARSIF